MNFDYVPADRLPAVPLETVLTLRGARQDPHDRSKWHTERGPLSVTGGKFMNWHSAVGEASPIFTGSAGRTNVSTACLFRPWVKLVTACRRFIKLEGFNSLSFSAVGEAVMKHDPEAATIRFNSLSFSAVGEAWRPRRIVALSDASLS